MKYEHLDCLNSSVAMTWLRRYMVTQLGDAEVDLKCLHMGS